MRQSCAVQNRRSLFVAGLVAVLLGAACGARDGAASYEPVAPVEAQATLDGREADGDDADAGEADVDEAAVVAPEVVAADEAGNVEAGDLEPGDIEVGDIESLIDAVFSFNNETATEDFTALARASDQPELGWLWADLLRFTRPGELRDWEIVGFRNATGFNPEPLDEWGSATNWLIANDVPAPANYRERKRRLFTTLEPAWDPFFADESSDIDWRILSWGGVLIDDRPVEETNEPCPDGCIPALDDPDVTDADGGDWYDDDRIVFGVVINDEARAYPKNLMEIHEMVNDELGGRRIGMPYCTLCGAAQAFLTDELAEGFTSDLDRYELRTSGLLSRSNKVMFELQTNSVFDTFTGRALSGPLQDLSVHLDQVPVITTTWGEWKAQYPETTILSQLNPWGWPYADDPLGGRDDNGPIFPIGDVDARLGVQTPVVGVMTADGWVAFVADAAEDALLAGASVEAEGISLQMDAGGLVAFDASGQVASHQAFWFAWSQFHPDTALWDGS